MLNPKICGKWDGCALWLQWQPLGEDVSYDLELRYRTADKEWTEWTRVVMPQGEKSYWGVLPTYKEGAMAQARVARAGTDDFEIANEVHFRKCTCLFEISSEKLKQHFPKGTIFHAQVDAAACAFELEEEILVEPGKPVCVRLLSKDASGYQQLDHENHLDIRPLYGVRIRNLEPSVDDIEETGRDFTVIEPKPMDVMTLTVTPRL